ncbi:hypothetical protein [Microtetraspora sp. NBRC 16547]|uniref:hypothetical protein n=1 Tax=Microtetraspora sp. NBRC 16547 TaxID=3030993 RepID=UPI0024A04223|nr:hypothetical protein [Microtetraspora sp. NBRC 16547]GLW98892.1 hypothetical protein Misp02_29790 [Microtetraspora sp. NBRC 16547]
MTVTFGDLIDGAQAHMEIADLHVRHEVDATVSAGVFNAARSLTAMLARCARDFARSDEIARPIREASHLLARWEPNHAASSHPIPTHLSAAATAWGAAGDVLATHFSADGTGTRSDWTTVITSQQVRDRLVRDVAGHALALSAILDRTALAHAADVRFASGLLRSPVLIAASTLDGSAALREVPLNRPAIVQPVPHQPETPDELRAGITADTDALRTLCHLDTGSEPSPREWQRTALAASVSTHIGTRLLTELTRRAYELNPDRKHGLGKALQRATNGIDGMHAMWKGVRQAWEGHLPSKTANGSTRQQHLDQVVVRLGRLLYADPLWTPARRNAMSMKTPEVIAPTTRDMVPALRSVLRVFDALTVIAEQDRHGVTRAMRTERLPEDLVQAYGWLTSSRVRASWALGEALFHAADPGQRPELWQEVDLLEMRRDPATYSRQTLREREGTRQWLEWLSTRDAVAESHLNLSISPAMAPATTSARSSSIGRDTSRTPHNRPG